MDDDMRESLQIFSEEAEDLLSVAEQALLDLDETPENNMDSVNELFRAFHTIKGAAGLFGLDSIVAFTHVVESLLGSIREGKISVDGDMISLFLSSRDHLQTLVDRALNEEALEPAEQQINDTLLAQLEQYLGTGPAPAEETTEAAAATSDTSSDKDNWHISLRFGADALVNGMDPASFIGYLEKLGTIAHLAVIEDNLPEWAEYDPEACYLGFEIELHAKTDKASIEDVFEFVQDDCSICILPPGSHIKDYVNMIEQLPEEDMRIGDILVASGAITERELSEALNQQSTIADDQVGQAATDDTVPQLGKVAVEQQSIQQPVVDAAVQKQREQKAQRANAEQSIRVNAQKLESLVNLVGELVISNANAYLHSDRLADQELTEAMETLARLVEQVRDTALGLRMVQIGDTFNRYKRVVREVSRQLGKEIELHISGAETELDKTLIEKIGDPLMHLVRNSVDHGIETPEIRIKAGKSPVGVLNLDAFHDSGSIVIQVRDDGGGLNKERIRAKAEEKELILPDQTLSDGDIYRLIFEPGFSTAEKVSNISGRGVGMDVVRKNIDALRGQVDVTSEAGKGSIFSIRLPLTLAIIDGFQVRVGSANYIVPLDMIDECIELSEALRGQDDAEYINLRGEVLPYMRLSDMFQCQSDDASGKHKDNIVVVQCAGKKAGLLVDELLGEHQTVIKPLGKVFQNLKGISGATILGSGEVAMIIDVPQLVQQMIDHATQHMATTHSVH